MSQTKLESFKESITNVLIGFLISFLAGFIIFPICNIQTTVFQNILSTIGFTLVSICRQYIIRRWFNKKEKSVFQKTIKS